MGGKIKADLPTPDGAGTLVERWLANARSLGWPARLVGSQSGMASGVDVPRLDDDPAGIGPLGGLRALLGEVGDRPAIAVACDMPYVTSALLQKLAQHPATTPVVAPRERDADRWQPLFARYDPVRVLPVLDAALADSVRSFQGLFERLEVAELMLDDGERGALRDWDTPQDVTPP